MTVWKASNCWCLVRWRVYFSSLLLSVTCSVFVGDTLVQLRGQRSHLYRKSLNLCLFWDQRLFMWNESFNPLDFLSAHQLIFQESHWMCPFQRWRIIHTVYKAALFVLLIKCWDTVYTVFFHVTQNIQWCDFICLGIFFFIVGAFENRFSKSSLVIVTWHHTALLILACSAG